MTTISLLLSLVSISLLTEARTGEAEAAGAQQRLESEITVELDNTYGGSYRFKHLDTFCLDDEYKQMVTGHIAGKNRLNYFSLVAGTRNPKP